MDNKNDKNKSKTPDYNAKIKEKIDQSIFDDDTIRADEYYAPKTSTTIDTTLLVADPVKYASTHTRTRTGATRYSQVERYYPSIEQGLTDEQVKKRKEQGLDNVSRQKGGTTYASIVLKNILTWFNILTFVVAISLICVNPANWTKCMFMVIVVINILIGIIQEVKSKRTVDKLKLLTAPMATVVRDGEKISVPVGEIVLDDIVYLELGKQICSDCTLVKGECEVNESMLTGESVAVKKKQGDELFSGSFVSSGNCYARVTRTGDLNYVSRLSAKAKKYRKPKSELHSSIEAVIKIVSFIIIPVAILMLSYGIPKIGLDPTVKETGGAIIGMIPSGMFLLTSIALASAVIKLSRKQTMVRDLYCIEMLARVDTLCLDKTGTITDGTMQLKEVVGYKGDEEELKKVMASFLAATEDNNQTAIALANYFGRNQSLSPLAVMPFSSQKKLSAVTFDGEGTYFLGAPEFVITDLSVKAKKKIEDYARGGYRVLLLARSPYDIKDDKLPSTRKEICYFVIEDHIRPEAYDTIKWFKDNRVTVKVISGDNPITVSEIAAKVGVENADKFVSLEGMSNQQVREVANRYTVFGRVTPEQKRILVTAMKADKHTVAMTGDGVNDILALREADCSVAMASGSEAARNVSHLVLMNSDFSSMPEVVKEGRRVINNIQNSSSLYLMKTFMSVVLSILSVIFAYCGISGGKIYFFDTSSLLALEFCIIGLPSVFLALQPNDALVEGKFLSNILKKCLAGGVAMVLAVLAVYLYKTFGLAAGASAEDFDSIYPRVYETMLVVVVVYTGFMSLVVICKPFDTFRVWVCVGTFVFATVFLTAVVELMAKIGLGEVIGNIKVFLTLDFQFLTFIATVILVNYFVIMLITKALNNLMSKKKGEQTNGNQTT